MCNRGILADGSLHPPFRPQFHGKTIKPEHLLPVSRLTFCPQFLKETALFFSIKRYGNSGELFRLHAGNGRSSSLRLSPAVCPSVLLQYSRVPGEPDLQPEVFEIVQFKVKVFIEVNVKFFLDVGLNNFELAHQFHNDFGTQTVIVI